MHLLAFLSLIILALSGCTTPRKALHHAAAYNLPPGYIDLKEYSWWSCKFRISWPEEEEIDFSADLLLAHGVVAPVLVDNIEDIPYWRFHRRAKRDAAGHQFSFIFHSSRETAEAVFAAIENNDVLRRALAANIVSKTLTDNTDKLRKTEIEDGSDESWSNDLQKNWPPFIMGVSSMWLGMIDDGFSGSPKDYSDVTKLLEKYRDVNGRITKVWQREGHHALFHHINALFGYEPVILRKKMVF